MKVTFDLVPVIQQALTQITDKKECELLQAWLQLRSGNAQMVTIDMDYEAIAAAIDAMAQAQIDGTSS